MLKLNNILDFTTTPWFYKLLRQGAHGITRWFGLEVTSKTFQFQPPHHGQNHLPLQQADESSSNLALNTSKESNIHSFSEQTVL